MKNPMKLTPVILALLASAPFSLNGQPLSSRKQAPTSTVLSETGPHHRMGKGAQFRDPIRA